MRRIIGKVELPFHGVTLGVRRVCNVHDEPGEVEHAGPSHNELYVETYSDEKKATREILRMRTGTDCSADNLPEFLNYARKAIDDYLSKMRKPNSKVDREYLIVIPNDPGESAEQAMRDFAYAFASAPSTQIAIMASS